MTQQSARTRPTLSTPGPGRDRKASGFPGLVAADQVGRPVQAQVLKHGRGQAGGDSGHSDVTPLAANILGSLLQQEGDLAGTRAAFQLAMDSSDTAVALLAELHLTRLLTERRRED
jgi:hypothetical protein